MVGCTNPIAGDSGKSAANPAEVARNKASPASRTKDLFIDTHSPHRPHRRQSSSAKNYPGGESGHCRYLFSLLTTPAAKLFSEKNDPGGGESGHYRNPGAEMT